MSLVNFVSDIFNDRTAGRRPGCEVSGKSLVLLSKVYLTFFSALRKELYGAGRFLRSSWFLSPSINSLYAVDLDCSRISSQEFVTRFT